MLCYIIRAEFRIQPIIKHCIILQGAPGNTRKNGTSIEHNDGAYIRLDRDYY